MGIRITNKNAKYPKGIKIASEIASYLFEEQYREIECMPESDEEECKERSWGKGTNPAEYFESI